MCVCVFNIMYANVALCFMVIDRVVIHAAAESPARCFPNKRRIMGGWLTGNDDDGVSMSSDGNGRIFLCCV